MRTPLLLLTMLLACDGDPGPPPTAPFVPAAPTSASRTAVSAIDLHLPSLDPDPPTPLAALDAPRPPDTHRLPDGRRFIHDSERGRIAVHDAVTDQPIDLGEAILVAVPGLGWLVRPRHDGPLRYCDVDPTAARLRVLWEVPEHRPPAITDTLLAGLDRGAPLFVRRSRTFVASSPTAITDPDVELVRIRGPNAVDTTIAPLGAHSVPSTDAVRDGRLLLIGPRDRPDTAAIFIFDLETHALRSLGDARADLTRNTSAPHPYVAVRWRDHAPHAHDHDWAEDCINFVDPASEQLTACLPQAHPWSP